jgi:hypothetical protein
MSGIATAVVGSAVVGGVIASQGAKSAANAQARSADAASAEQARQYDQTRQDFAPWRAAGQTALANLADPNKNFMASPDYAFTKAQGMRGIESSAAARGGAFSGNALRSLDQFNSNLASTQFGDWWNRQAGLAGVGQQATGSTAAAGQNAANNISNNTLAAGDARASGIIGGANAWSNAFAGVGNYAAYGGFSKSGYQPPNYYSGRRT